MIFSRASIMAALFSLVAADKLNYTIVEPEYDTWGVINTGLKAAMKPTTYKAELLEAGWVPETCFNGPYLEGIEGKDMDVYSVTFGDCAEPFIVCRHKNTPATPEMIFTGLATLTGRMRQWVGNFVAIPEVKEGLAAWQSGPTIVVQNKYWESPSLLIHEMAHAMDLIKLGSGSTGGTEYWTDQSVWRDRFLEDGHVPTSYATTNYIEAFAEAAILKAYDLLVPGGLAQLPQNSDQLSSQLRMMNVIYSDFMLPRCNAKVPSSRMVSVPVSRRRRSTTRRAAAEPNVAVSHVPEIHVPEELYTMEPHAEEAFDMGL